jgi:thiol:disulfide interchange protein
VSDFTKGHGGMIVRSEEEESMEPSGSIARRDMLVSMGLLALIIVLALGRIALDSNWQKVLRVSLAFLVYVTVLFLLARIIRARFSAESAPLPFWIFAVSAMAAELSSGWLRPDWRVSDLLAMPVAAALLVGGFHWMVLRAWRPLRERIGLSRNVGQGREASSHLR